MASSKKALDWVKNTKIIICDDHVAVRTGLRSILEEEQFVVVETCDSVSVLASAVSKYPEAIVITDLGIGGLTFPDLVKQIHQHSRKCRIIAYSMRDTPATISICYEVGALAFVPKGADTEELFKAIENATNGKKYFPHGVAENLANLQVDKNNPRNILSARELEILLCYVECNSIGTMVAKLGLTEGSVQNALSVISKKLNTQRSMFYKLVGQYGLDGFSK